MTLEFRTRRVITGHDREGKAIIVADDVLDAELLKVPGAGGNPQVAAAAIELWGTATSPVDNSDAALATQKRGWRGHTQEGLGQRSMFRIGRLPPGSVAPMHRTESVDYAILVEGECDLLLDGGQTTTLRAGDVVIQRGTMHSWANRGDKPCTWLFILLDAHPVKVNGAELKQVIGAAPDVAQFYPAKPAT